MKRIAKELFIHLFYDVKMDLAQWNNFLKEVKQKLNYGIAELEADLSNKFDQTGEFIIYQAIEEKLKKVEKFKEYYLAK